MPRKTKSPQTVDNTVDKPERKGPKKTDSPVSIPKDTADSSSQSERSEVRQPVEAPAAATPWVGYSDQHPEGRRLETYQDGEVDEEVVYQPETDPLYQPTAALNGSSQSEREGQGRGAPTLTVTDARGTTRLAVFGSDNWEQPETIARTLLNWWLDHERPTLTLVIGGDNRFDEQSKAIVNEQKFSVEEHPLNPAVSPRSTRKAQIRGILELQIDHAIVFIRNQDRLLTFAARYAATMDVPLTVVRVDDDPEFAKLGLFLQ